jgi:hypothetical protein
MKNTAISIGQFWINKLSLACACVVLGLGYAAAQPAATAADTSITAIDILLLPDATMIQRAEAVNNRLRSVFPKGFSLDASHHPHISMFQCFVHTADLAKVFVAADKVFASGNVTNLKLTAFKYYYIPDKALGLSGIVIKPTAELIKVQSDLIAAVPPPHGEDRNVGGVCHHARKSGHQSAVDSLRRGVCNGACWHTFRAARDNRHRAQRLSR